MRNLLLCLLLFPSGFLFSQVNKQMNEKVFEDSLRVPYLEELALSYYSNKIAGVQVSVQQFSNPEIKIGVFLGRGFLCQQSTLHSVLTYHYFINKTDNTREHGQALTYGIRVTTPGKFKGGLGFHYGLYFLKDDYELLFGLPEVFFGYKRFFLAFQVHKAPNSGHLLGYTYLGFKKDINFSATYYIPLVFKSSRRLQYKRKYWLEIKNGKWLKMQKCLN